MARRSSSSVTNLFSDILDDVKDFFDDEIIDRTRSTEKDLRKTARNWTDSDDDAKGSSRRETADLHDAVVALTAKVDALAAKK